MQDLPLLERWLQTPDVAQWWGDPEEEAAFLRADMSEPQMVMRIVSFDGQPFAYTQDYEVHIWPQSHFSHLPTGTRSIDSFIGKPDMISKGHGSAFLKVLAEQLRADGAPVVAIDPDASNLRARRAYEKAGLRTESIVLVEGKPVALMIFEN